jgi:hypothetical protein
MPCLSHPPWLDHSSYTWSKNIKLLIAKMFPVSCYSYYARLHLWEGIEQVRLDLYSVGAWFETHLGCGIHDWNFS